jgi:hypothetical protein
MCNEILLKILLTIGWARLYQDFVTCINYCFLVFSQVGFFKEKLVNRSRAGRNFLLKMALKSDNGQEELEGI